VNAPRVPLILLCSGHGPAPAARRIDQRVEYHTLGSMIAIIRSFVNQRSDHVDAFSMFPGLNQQLHVAASARMRQIRRACARGFAQIGRSSDL
jgi:hypothetical protein